MTWRTLECFNEKWENEMSSKIEWTKDTWNPITGCSKCSPGCENCYALTLSRRLAAMGKEKYKGVVADCGDGQGWAWTGKVRCHEDALEIPRKRKKPTVYFVCSMSDIGHPTVPHSFFVKVWRVMFNATQHRFLLLTKRPQVLAEQIARLVRMGERINLMGAVSNVAVGVTVCNQKEWNEKVPILCQIPAAMRFVSVEPMLGPVVPDCDELEAVDWVICGTESGPSSRRRPLKLNWVRDLRDACLSAEVPFFLKQIEVLRDIVKMPEIDGDVWNERPEWFFGAGRTESEVDGCRHGPAGDS